MLYEVITDGFALQLAVKLGYPIAIITGGKTEAIKTRYENLGIKNVYMGSSDKMPVFTKWLEENNLKADEVLYMGDDIPDYPVMKRVGIPTCPSDAVEEIKSLCKFV